MTQEKLKISDLKKYIKKAKLSLKPTQNELQFSKLKKFIEMIQEGRDSKISKPISILDDMIIEGHHRYISYGYCNKEIETKKSGKNITVHSDKLSWRNIKINE